MDSEQPPVKRARKSATTMESKLLIILDTLDENQIDMRQLLRTLARQRKDNRCRKYWLQFRRFAYQDMTRKYDNNSLPELDSSDWDKLLDAGGRHRIHHELRKELSRLANNKSVVTWESPSSDSLGFIEKLDSIKDIINAEAPALVKMLSLIARPSDSPASEPLTMGLRQAMWICMFLFSMQSHRCNGLAKTLTLYLMDSGVKKRVVDQLSSLNVCVSYTTGQTMIKKLRGFGAAEVRKRGVDLRNCTSYDNYDYVEHKSAERLGSRKEQKGITTALQYRGIGISEQGLRQSMWRPHHKIRVKDIVIDNNYIKLILKKVD